MNNESPSISLSRSDAAKSKRCAGISQFGKHQHLYTHNGIAISCRSEPGEFRRRRGTNEEEVEGPHNVVEAADDRRLFVRMDFRFAESGPSIDELHYTRGISVVSGCFSF